MASSDRSGLTTLIPWSLKSKQFNHSCHAERLNLIWSHSLRLPLHIADSTGGHDMPFKDHGTGEAGKGLSPCFSNWCIALSFLRGEVPPVWCLSVWKSCMCNWLLPGEKSKVLDRKWLPTGALELPADTALPEGSEIPNHLRILLFMHIYLTLSFSARWNGC